MCVKYAAMASNQNANKSYSYGSHAHSQSDEHAFSPSQQLVTLPRKRRPRAVGEVSITCPASSVYLNAEIQTTSPETEPIYQNEAVVFNQRCSYKKQQQQQKQRQHLSVLRVAHVERGDATKISMVVSTFVGSFNSQHYQLKV